MLKQEAKDKVVKVINEAIESLKPLEAEELGKLLTEIGFAIQIATKNTKEEQCLSQTI